ncbi:MAG: recombinase family protein [Streptosporangiaceae bacterium]
MRVLGAVRLSAMTDETTSPERQREAIGHTAAARGDKVIHITEDLDVSGAVSPFDRDDLGPWLTEPATISAWDVLIVAKLDRLSRSTSDLDRLVKWCLAHGKVLVSVSESIDIATSTGRLFVKFLALFAEFERERISERRSEAAATLRQSARWGGGRVPYGYAAEGNGHGYVLVPDPAEQAVVQRAAAEAIGGKSVTAVCAGLKHDGIQSQSGKAWKTSVLLRILRSPVIRGYLVSDGEIVRDSDGMPVQREGLIDDGTWRALQRALDANSSPGSGSNSDAALLLQVAFCACGAPMYQMNKKGTGQRYYRCATARAGGSCTGRSVRMNVLEELVTGTLLDAAGTVPMQERIVIPAEDHQAELAKVTEQLAGLQDQFMRDKLSAEIFATMAGKLETRQKRLGALPATPERVVMVPTGQTFGEHWSGLTDAGRHAFLTNSNVRVVVDGVTAGAVPMDAATLSDRMISLSFAGGRLVTVDLGGVADLRDLAATA